MHHEVDPKNSPSGSPGDDEGLPFRFSFPYDEAAMAEIVNVNPFEPIGEKAIRQKISRPSLSYWQDAWIRLKKNKQALFSLYMIVGLVLFTVIGPFVWTIDPTSQDLTRVSEGPNFGKRALVQEMAPAYEEIVDANALAPKELSAEAALELPAPGELQVMGSPSLEAVRLKWPLVKDAAAYVIYRSESTPDSNNKGIAIGEVDAGNKLSYEDTFNLEPRTYYYSVVPKNVEESVHFVSRTVSVPRSVTLEEARSLDPDIKVGDTIDLPSHPMGTDNLGRDLLARLMAGGRVSLFFGFFAPLLYVLLGVIVGGISGYAGGNIDAWLMRFTDFVLALPFLLFMILFKVSFGTQPGESGIVPMLIAIIVLSWVTAARLTRGQVLALRESEFVQAARLLGAKPWYLIVRHLLPNTLGVLLVTLTFAIPNAIFTEAFLSFIGMGVAPPTASWGSMCNDGIRVFLVHPHEFFFPALFISLTVLAFNRFGDGLRDALDPRLRASD